VQKAAEKVKQQITNGSSGIKPVFQSFWISMEFDFFRYVSIFLTSFGHNSGTNVRAIVAAVAGARGTRCVPLAPRVT
jgi:hypothetical protein